MNERLLVQTRSMTGFHFQRSIKKTLAVESKDVATPEKVSKWKNLNPNNSEITQTNDTEIRMLIGASCVKCVFITSLNRNRNI